MANKREDSKLKIAKDAITQDWKRRQGKIGSLIGNQWLLTPISITDGILIAFLTPKRLNFSDPSTESLSIWKAKRPFDNSTRRRTWNILSRKENFKLYFRNFISETLFPCNFRISKKIMVIRFGECLSAIHFFLNSWIELLLRKKMEHTKVILMTDLKIGTLVFNHFSKKIVYRDKRILQYNLYRDMRLKNSHSFRTLSASQQSYSRDMLPVLILSYTETWSKCFLYFHQRINFQKISVHQELHRDDNLKLLG